MRKMINMFVSAVIGISLFIPTPAQVFVETSSAVPIHSQPYVQSAIVGVINDQALIQNVLNQYYEGWTQIQSGNVQGWIDKRYLIEAPLRSLGYTVAIVHADKLNVRSGPNTTYSIIKELKQGDTVECVKKDKDWLTLAFKDGTYGFVDACFTELKTYYDTAKTIIESQEQKNTIIEIPFNDSQSTNFEKNKNIIKYNNSVPPEKEYNNQIISTEEIEQQNIDYEDLARQDRENEQRSIYSYSQADYDNYYDGDYDYNYVPNDEYYPEYDYQYEEQQQEEENYDYNYNYDDYYNYDEEQDNSDQYYSQNNYNYIQNDEYQEQNYSSSEQDYNDYSEEDTISSNRDNSDIISYGSQFVGNPYVWGGNSLTDGIDCSHFVWQVLSNTGHYDGDYEVSDGWASLGTAVDSLDDAVAGDVIVYPGHVALYDGQGGLLQARGSAYGITNDREATYNNILAIRHFD